MRYSGDPDNLLSLDYWMRQAFWSLMVSAISNVTELQKQKAAHDAAMDEWKAANEAAAIQEAIRASRGQAAAQS